MIGEAIAHLFGELILGGLLRGIAAVVGWVYMWVRYRSAFRVKYVLAREYNRSYIEAGAAVGSFVLQVLVLATGVVILGGLVYALYVTFLT